MDKQLQGVLVIGGHNGQGVTSVLISARPSIESLILLFKKSG